jgi:molybdate transport system regulatory protein
MTRKTTGCRLRPRLRVLRGDEVVLGPGKAELLDAIARTGELRRAAGELNMSYMRAWKLVQTMNSAFRDPLVATTRGGAGHGAAGLTKTGRTVLAVYHEMERRSLAASGPGFRRLRKLLAV